MLLRHMHAERMQAARQGMSLNDYLRGELEAIAARPTLPEMIERLRRRGPAITESVAPYIRADRDSR